MLRTMPMILSLLVLLLMVPALLAQQDDAATTQAIARAEAKLNAAEASGAKTFAAELYDEAVFRLNLAKEQLRAQKAEERRAALLRAIEAELAADAAQARARWLSTVDEIRSLRGEITRRGGRVEEMSLPVEPKLMLDRGQTSMDRVEVAEAAIARAKQAGGERLAPEDLARAEEITQSARQIARTASNSTSADHLAYVAEMLARRAEYLSHLENLGRVVPDLRVERTRLVQVEMEAQAAEERRRRERREQELAEMRERLEREERSRQLDRAEIERLETQVRQHREQLAATFGADRAARLQAEAQLDRLRAEYVAVLARAASRAEVESVRQGLEDQRLLVESLQTRERQTEEATALEIDRLRDELQREREADRLSTRALQERQNAIAQMNQELERLRVERQEHERSRVEAEQSFRQGVEAAQQRARDAEAESRRLREQVEAERQRALEAEARLAHSRQEVDQLRLEDTERAEQLKRALAELAETRTESRGFILTLPGLYFDTGRAALKAGTRNNLSRIAGLLAGNEKARVIVEGHTDSVGAEAMNQTLSEARAKAVADYLVAQGFPRARIETIGYGESSPIASNDTVAGRQQNRRVELVISLE